MENLDLIRIKLRLECIDVDISGPFNKLVRVGGSTCDDIERLLITKTPNGQFRSFFGDYALGAGFNLDLQELFEASKEDATKAVPTVDLRRSLWYYCPGPGLLPHDLVTNIGDTLETFDTHAIMHDGKVVAKTWSIRKNDVSAESATEVTEPYRRRGYGKQLIASWSAYQLKIGKVGIHCMRGNIGSQLMVERNGGVLIADVLSFH